MRMKVESIPIASLCTLVSCFLLWRYHSCIVLTRPGAAAMTSPSEEAKPDLMGPWTFCKWVLGRLLMLCTRAHDMVVQMVAGWGDLQSNSQCCLANQTTNRHFGSLKFESKIFFHQMYVEFIASHLFLPPRKPEKSIPRRNKLTEKWLLFLTGL